ncbi:hypothetical protein AAC387_Pa12g0501 [Persea americana]
MPFWLVTVVEVGVRFPLHPLLRDCLWEWYICPCQLLPNGYKIIMGVVQLNKILGISLDVSDIEDVYDLCKSVDGNSYYLRLRTGQVGFVITLEDSYRYAGDDRVFVRWEWEFSESETSRSIRIPRKMETPPSKGQNLFGFRFSILFYLYTCRTDTSFVIQIFARESTAWLLLGYTLHYRSFKTTRRVIGIDSVLLGEGTSTEQVTVAIPPGRLVESGDWASAPHPDSDPAETAAVEAGTSSLRRRRVVASSSSASSSSEEEDRMLRRRRQRFVAENLSDSAFGGVRDKAPDAPQSASGALASSPPAAVVRITAVAAAAAGIPPAPLSPAVITIDDSPPKFSQRAEGWERPAEVVEEGRPGKRPRTEVPLGPSSPSPTEEAPSSPPLVTWRPDIEDVLGRLLAVTDHSVANLNVVAALGRACALPLDMEKWEAMDDASLLVSAMRSAVAVMQKCQVGLARSERAGARATEWAAKKEKLQQALDAKDRLLKEEASKNGGLAADLE